MSNRVKLLYVDDEELNLQLFAINFKKQFEVHTAFNGFEGLELLEKHPDTLIIVSDMKMPKMNGIEFIKIAKEKYPEKKFFILTGFGITEEINHALESGLILDYFRKPFNITEIKSSINSAIAGK